MAVSEGDGTLRNMNRIVIVGHPASGAEEVLALLKKCGMSEALPSRREGLLPQAVTATLCKAHKLPPVASVTDEADFAQIKAAPVWHGMALDLMLGNLDQPLWGWADPQMIYALDYWEALDPQLTFVLVYDEPHRALMDAASPVGADEGDAPGPDLGKSLDNWVAYNGALLRFHLRHPGRSLLVHSQQAQRATDRYVEQLQPLLNAPLRPSSEAAALPGPGESAEFSMLVPLAKDIGSALGAVGVEPEQIEALLQADPAERYLVNDVLSRYPAVTQMYAELQSIANLPLDAPPREPEGVAAAAWDALLQRRGLMSRVLVRLHGEVRRAGDELARSQRALQEEKSEAAKALAKAQDQAQQLHDQSRQLQAEVTAQAQQLRSTSEENRLLLAQLHKVQEELERHYHLLTEAERAKGDADNALARLQDEAKQQSTTLRSLSEQNDLLLGQLHRANEELERYYLRLAEAERGKASAEKALADSSCKLDRLKDELQDWTARPPDLTIVPSRKLVSTLVRRLVKRVLPASLLRLWRRRRGGHDLTAENELQLGIEQIRGSRWFDAAWYLETYQDVKQSGTDAVEHYHVHGWREGRRPGPEFDSEYYLTAYPDVRQADIDPLVHFIRHGANEGRRPKDG